MKDFSIVTEVAGEPISLEQLNRLRTRYCWARDYCRGKDVVEVGCGTGPGLGVLAEVASSVCAGDVHERFAEIVARHYGDRVSVDVFDAERLPYPDRSKDVVLLFEAIYYLPDAERFVEECKRILRPGGVVLVVTVNPKTPGFHRSEFSVRYYTLAELEGLFTSHGFEPKFWGSSRLDLLPARQRISRPLKRVAVRLGLIPRTMAGKRWLKRIVFGAETVMPAEIDCNGRYPSPEPLPASARDELYQILHCAATLKTA